MGQPGSAPSSAGFKPSKRSLLIGGGIAVTVAVFVWYRRSQSASTATTADAATTDTTGMGSAGSVDAGAYGGGVSGYVTSGTGLSPGGLSGPVDNAAWAADATQALSAVGDDPTQVAQALGAYITGQPITSQAQEDLIHQAIAYTDYPPVAGASGYPPAVHTQPATGQSGGTGGSVTQPATNPRPAKPAAPHATAITSTSVSLATSPVPGATLYEWSVNGANRTHTSGPTVTITGLHSKTTYRFSVEAQTATARGDNSAETSITTH